ncbi:MAG: cellulase family glycosylhydrolase [Bacteroidetes bacterium]|nr:cellulase family glycosylhydrolase [Bacteroidota bacterium]MBS1974136.1 cellulase family glycosylhydrolase [Bacteroidota bacterium]
MKIFPLFAFSALLLFACKKEQGGNGNGGDNNNSSSYLKISGRYLKDANGADVFMRGVNVDAYKEGWENDVDDVAAAVAKTKANVVRLAWWTHINGSPEPQAGTTYYTPNDLDHAITAFAGLGILPILMLHDLTGKNDPQQFQNIITAFWTSPSIVSVITKHQNHLVINMANEWGANYFTNQNNYSQNDITTYIDTYKTAITAIRNAGIKVPLVIDAYGYGDREEIFTSGSYGQNVSNGQHLLNQDPLHNLIFSVHAYYWENDWQTNQPTVDPTPRLNSIANSGLPFVIGEMGNILPDGSAGTGYADFLTKANNLGIGYLAWAWYNDGTTDQTGTAPYAMNITINNKPQGDGVTIPSSPNDNSWGYNILNANGYGINTALPATKKIAFPN